MEIFSCVSQRPVATCLLLFTIVTTVIAATDGSSEKNSASESTSSDTTEKLKTEILYTPEVCTTKSKNGDMLTMHYKGTLQDGTTFDSR
jgi:FKBP-type peptidyl-prolyl cis-trans isomerase